MKLAIISHTEHYLMADGTIVGWGPTITEINHLLKIFDEIYHVAMLYDEMPPPSALPYNSDKVKFVAMPSVGGQAIKAKFNMIFKAPRVLKTVNSVLKKVDCFQLRTPTGIGVFLIPYLTLLSKKKGWFKYAGNWNQKNAPIGYAIQRWMLKRQSRPVTINGMWEQQPKHCLSFENPCLTVEDVEVGKTILKSLNGKISFCYVGRLEREKGVERIIKAFLLLSPQERSHVDQVHLVGNGVEVDYFKSLTQSSDISFQFHGFLPRKQVHDIYKSSHVFLMPTTASEGFPKVIAEAINFKCLPVVSNISSIGHYIKTGDNGIVLSEITSKTVAQAIRELFSFDDADYERMNKNNIEIAKRFTFLHYNNRIKSLVEDKV
ncbi:glycosyltransferase [uncultured Psychroserpens sp.]|uniref:glycosyltransferase n=1 Tax=uncultured Psychroserpens sp. TaxID=255436 RepID=UPI002607610C|nr:glycosyltransferase [uncultured Psychroserpens sp.]